MMSKYKPDPVYELDYKPLELREDMTYTEQPI